MSVRQVSSVKEMLGLNDYGSVAELMPYFNFVTDQEDVEHGAILLCNGSLMITFRYRGKDLASLNNFELNNIQFRISQSLKILEEGWSIHTDLIREKVNSYIKPEDNEWGNNFTAEILDEEGREAFTSEKDNIESKFYITLVWLPPNSYINKIDNMLYSTGDENSNVEKSTKLFYKQKDEFWNICNKIVGTLSLSLTEIEYLNRNETLSFLDKCWNDDGQSYHLRNCQSQPFLSSLLGKRDIQTELLPKVGEKYVGVVSVYDLPNAVYPGIIDFLNSVNLELRLNCRFVCQDDEKALKYLSATIEKWKSKRISLWGRIAEILNIQYQSKGGENAQIMADEASSLIKKVEGKEVKYGFYNCSIVLFDKDIKELKKKLYYLETQLSSLQFVAKVEDNNSMDAYIGSQPGCTFENLIQLPIFTDQLSCLFPITSYWAGDTSSCQRYKEVTGKNPVMAYMKTDANSPFRFTHHYGNVGHTMIVGQSESGKSVFLLYLVTQQMRYKNSHCFFFDKGGSSRVLNYAFNGKFYDPVPLSDDNEELKENIMKFQPLRKINTREDQEWALEWLCDIVRLYDIEPNPAQITRMKEALLDLVKSRRTMTEFVTFLQDQELKDIFGNYISSDKNGIGKIFDGEDVGIELDRFTVFEMEGLFRIGNKKIIYPLVKYLLKTIEDMVKLTGCPSLIILDEAWSFLDNPIFETKMGEWLRTIRKYSCSVIFATQSLSEAFESKINKVILQECHTKIMLPNESIGNPTIMKYYIEMGFNDNEINGIIRNAIPKRQYYITKGRDKRLVELALELRPLLASLITGASPQITKLAKEMKEKHGDDFVYYWWQRYSKKANIDFSYWLELWKKEKIKNSNKKIFEIN